MHNAVIEVKNIFKQKKRSHQNSCHSRCSLRIEKIIRNKFMTASILNCQEEIICGKLVLRFKSNTTRTIYGQNSFEL